MSGISAQMNEPPMQPTDVLETSADTSGPGSGHRI